jgi:predicted RNA-binding protein with PIN domain
MILVDGYNAIRRVAHLKNAEERAGLEAGRRALLMAIAASGVLRSESVVVVFDGGPAGAASDPPPHRKLSVRYSVPPENADETILALLRKSREAPDSATVVTADSELAFEARSLGARTVSPGEWEALRVRRLKKPRGPARSGSDKPEPSASETDYWLRIFGGDE